MPATAGRVRMPHNNRMSTSASLQSSAIWKTTIGHDPYAGKDDKSAPSEAEVKEGRDKAAQVFAAARQQNLTDGASRDDFAHRMYRGLKGGKKRKADELGSQIDTSRRQELLEQEISSSEDEFVEVEKKKEKRKEKKKRKSKKEKKKRRYSSDEDSDDDGSSRRRKRKRSKKKHRRRRRDSSPDTSESSRRHRKKKHVNKSEPKEKSSSRKEEKEVFLASDTFNGSKRGYAFRSGEKGVGYYVDQPPQVNEKEREAALSLFKD